MIDRLNYLIGGLEPVGYHVVNVLLHTAVSWLLSYTCDRFIWREKQLLVMVKSSACTIKLSTLAAILFATHPIHTEAVSTVY